MFDENSLFISPPFGNYLHLPLCTSIKGSFTLHPRPGLLQQILSTLRFSFEHNGWINKIGLRNKGIDWAVQEYHSKPHHIISVAILQESDIDELLEKIPHSMNLELNVSCPNTDHALVNQNLDLFLHPSRKWCAIKLSPTTSLETVDLYYKQGFRQFHCSNTLPTLRGGLSGVSLIPYTSNLVTAIRAKYPDVQLVAGGGVRTWDTYTHYTQQCGANYVSVSSLLFNPFMFTLLYARYCFNKLC